MKELFSKIDSNVQIQAESKIIPSQAFTTLISADDLLATAKKEAEDFREKVKAEALALKEAESERGFSEGMAKWTKQIAELEGAQRALRDEMQKQIIELVIQCGKKILGRELKLSSDAIVDIVSQALKPVATHKHATIFVCKQDAEALEKNKKKLHEELERIETLAIAVRSDIERGGCVIETEAGIINAQLEVLWESLELALSSLMKQQ